MEEVLTDPCLALCESWGGVNYWNTTEELSMRHYLAKVSMVESIANHNLGEG